MAVELSAVWEEVCVAFELVSGVEDCGLGMVDEGELAPGVTGCCELGVVCATAQAVESSRIAVIKKVFLIFTSSWIFRPCWLMAVRRVKKQRLKR